MPASPPRSPAECFAAILQWLSRAVDARSAGGRLALPMIALILARIRGTGQRFARLAARIETGRFVPRRAAAAPRRIATGRPRRPNPLPQKFGWLLPLVPEAVAYRSQLEYLLRDPEMAALMQAAPAPMARVLRPLCWMLRVTPPPVLALPAKPRPPRKETPAAAPKQPQPQPPSRPPAPSWWREPPRRTRWSFARTCGPPRPA